MRTNACGRLPPLRPPSIDLAGAIHESPAKRPPSGRVSEAQSVGASPRPTISIEHSRRGDGSPRRCAPSNDAGCEGWRPRCHSQLTVSSVGTPLLRCPRTPGDGCPYDSPPPLRAPQVHGNPFFFVRKRLSPVTAIAEPAAVCWHSASCDWGREFLLLISLPPSSPMANPPPAGGPVGGYGSPPDCHSLPPTALRLPSSEGGFPLRRNWT